MKSTIRTNPECDRNIPPEKKAQHLQRPRHPMPGYILSALQESGLFDAYKNRPPYQQNDYLGWIGPGET